MPQKNIYAISFYCSRPEDLEVIKLIEAERKTKEIKQRTIYFAGARALGLYQEPPKKLIKAVKEKIREEIGKKE